MEPRSLRPLFLLLVVQYVVHAERTYLVLLLLLNTAYHNYYSA